MKPPKLEYKRAKDRKNCEGLFCSGAFEVAHVAASGDVYMCCPPQLPTPIGNLNTGSFEDAWNSPIAQAIRKSILDGDFGFCDHSACPHLVSESGRVKKVEEVNDPFYEKIIAEGITEIPRGPKEIEPAYDFSCNLSCPSCRHELFVARGEPYERAKSIHEKVLNEALHDAERLTVSGQGDPFASRLYRDFLAEFDQEKYPNLSIWITTNGLLLTPQMWKRIKKSHGAIDVMHVSMNGASPESFATNQEGGEFSVFLQNLEFVKGLRAAGEIPRFTLGFYVLENNWREMKEAVRLAKHFRADRITFCHMVNWGTFNDAEYAAAAIHLEAHPDHSAYREFLNDPIFKDPVAYLGNLAELLPEGFFDPEPDSRATPVELVKIEWPDLVSRLGLEPSQADRGQAVIASLKDEITSICGRKPSPDRQAPLEFLAAQKVASKTGSKEMKADGKPPGSADDEFLEYAAFEREPETRLTYLAAMSRAARTKWSEFVALLDPEQTEAMGRLGLRSLKSIMIDYDPFADEMSRLMAEQVKAQGISMSAWREARKGSRKKKVEWPELVGRIGLSPSQAEEAMDVIRSMKNEVTAIYLRPPAEDEPAPLEYLAERMASPAAGETPEEIKTRRDAAAKAFLEYAGCKQEPETDVTYLTAIGWVEKRKWRAFVSLLDPDQCLLFDSLELKSLNEITTGYNPFGKKVSELI